MQEFRTNENKKETRQKKNMNSFFITMCSEALHLWELLMFCDICTHNFLGFVLFCFIYNKLNDNYNTNSFFTFLLPEMMLPVSKEFRFSIGSVILQNSYLFSGSYCRIVSA